MNKKFVVGIILVVLSATVFPVTGLLPTNAGFPDEIPQTLSDPMAAKGPDDIWPMFRHDAGNTGCSEYYAPNTNHVKWKTNVSAEIGQTTPILYADKLYISTGWYYKGLPKITDLFNNTQPSPSQMLEELFEYQTDANPGLYCLDAKTGEELWNRSLVLPSDPAILDNKIYLTSIDYSLYVSVLYCLDATTGSTLWQKSIEGLVLSPTIVADGKIFIGCLDLYSYSGSMKCYDLSGNPLWNRPFGVYEVSWFSAPGFSDGHVYSMTINLYSYFNGKLYCLNADTGQIQWSKPIFTLGLWYYQTASPVCADGKVYITDFDIYSYGGYLKCFDGATGDIEWTYDLGTSLSLGSPAVTEDSVYITTFDLYGYYSWLYRFDMATGAFIWRVYLPFSSYFGIGSSPVCSADKILLTPGSYYENSSELYCFEKENGTMIWTYSIDSYVMGGPSIGDNIAYIADYEGNIYAFEDVLKIQNILGGILGVKAVIQNTGDISLDDITYNISVNGGYLGKINRTRVGLIQELRAEKSRIVLLIPIIGIGKIEVTVKVTMPEMNTITKTKQGIVLGSICILSS
jgi:eukaryotic-like serine/threonine-protein kinase